MNFIKSTVWGCGVALKKLIDWDDVWERFSILTVDANLSDREALRILKPITDRELYTKLELKFIGL